MKGWASRCGKQCRPSRSCLGHDAGRADDGVDRVCFGAHCEGDAEPWEALLQPLPVLVGVADSVHIHLQRDRHACVTACCQTRSVTSACQRRAAASDHTTCRTSGHHLAEAVAHVEHRRNQVEGALIGNLVEADAVPALAAFTLLQVLR